MSKTTLQPYLFFAGNCEEALEYYQKILDAKVDFLMRFKESPEPLPEDQVPANYGEKIMHASVRLGESVILVSDGCNEVQPFAGFSLSLSVRTEEEAERLFQALAAEGTVVIPLEKTFWSPRFGSVTDRFGVNWMINVHGEDCGS